MGDKRRWALFLFALLAIAPPVLTAFNRPPSPGDWPVAPIYLIAVWGLIIFFARRIARGDEQ